MSLRLLATMRRAGGRAVSVHPGGGQITYCSPTATPTTSIASAVVPPTPLAPLLLAFRCSRVFSRVLFVHPKSRRAAHKKAHAPTMLFTNVIRREFVNRTHVVCWVRSFMRRNSS